MPCFMNLHITYSRESSSRKKILSLFTHPRVVSKSVKHVLPKGDTTKDVQGLWMVSKIIFF